MKIRERIEQEDRRPTRSDSIELAAALYREWGYGNLVPADEVDARIEAAVAAERERCARIAECRGNAHKMNAVKFFQEGGYSFQTLRMELARAKACLTVGIAILEQSHDDSAGPPQEAAAPLTT